MALPTSSFYVYIMSNEARDAFYVSVTGYLSRRLRQHAGGAGFEDSKGNGKVIECKDLVYIEPFEQAAAALERSERILHWSNNKLASLVTTTNPSLRSLNQEIIETPSLH